MLPWRSTKRSEFLCLYIFYNKSNFEDKQTGIRDRYQMVNKCQSFAFPSLTLIHSSVEGVLCDPSPLRSHGQHPAAHRWPWPLALLWPDGWPWRLPDSGQGQTLGVQLPQEVQVEHHVHACWAAQPRTGPLCLHLQRVQAPCGDTLALHCVRGELLLTTISVLGFLQCNNSCVSVF